MYMHSAEPLLLKFIVTSTRINLNLILHRSRCRLLLVQVPLRVPDHCQLKRRPVRLGVSSHMEICWCLAADIDSTLAISESLRVFVYEDLFFLSCVLMIDIYHEALYLSMSSCTSINLSHEL